MGYCLERPTPATAASSLGCIGIPRLRFLLRCPERAEGWGGGGGVLSNLRRIIVHPIPLLLFTLFIGHPTSTTFPYAKADMKDASEDPPMKSSYQVFEGMLFSVPAPSLCP